jgi:hypothetical protein
MTFREKALYHQIHPLKLATDWGTGAIAFYLLWRHRLWPALLVMFVPAVVVSAALIRWVDLEPYQRSAFGRYVARSMTPAMQGFRLAGNGIMMLGAWYRRPEWLAGGLLVILFGWLRGILVRNG